MKREPIRIQEFKVPTITSADQRMIHNGYREFFRRRGIDVDAGGNAGRYMSHQERLAHRRRMAALADDGGAE